MRVEFRITSGSRAGQREVFDKDTITVGRHPSNDFRFHMDDDPSVSSKHAVIRIAGGIVTLSDLGSTNGTFVNGERLEGERRLADGDVVLFGTGGPRAEFALTPGGSTPTRGAPVVAARPRRDTTARIAEAVEAKTGHLRMMIGALAGLVVVGVGIAYWAGNRGTADARAQVEALMHRNDSLARQFEQTVAQLRGRNIGLDSALDATRRETDALRLRLQSAVSAGSVADMAAIQQDVEAAATRRTALIGAAQVDWEAVAAQNAAALVFVAADLGEEGLVSGTGFNVSPSGLIVTNRHVVEDSKGRPASRIAAKFENAEGKFKKVSLVKVSQTDELAWLRVDEGGRFPTVFGVARSADVRVGAPVAIIGYPFGTATLGMGGNLDQMKPRSSLTVGTSSKVFSDTLQLDVYAAQGSSGSPVFNAQGLVVGVLFGSPSESNGRMVYAVASSKLVAQMPPEGAAIVR